MYGSCDSLEIAQAQPCPLLASETLTGVTQLKIGDVCLFMFGRTYVILYFDPLVLVCYLGVRHPKLHSTESTGYRSLPVSP